MRGMALLLCLAVAAAVGAQEGGDKMRTRYGIEANLERFPQGTPQDTLKSVLKALE